MPEIKNQSNNLLAIAFSFPPKSSSGSIRNLKMLKYLPESGWNVNVLTIREKHFLRNSEGDIKTLKQIPETLTVIRTKCFFIEEFLGNLSTLRINKRKKITKDKIVSAENTGEVTDADGKDTAHKGSTVQKLKDFITDSLSIPDKHVGWIPFAVWGGIKTLRKKPVDIIYAVGKPWSGFFVGYLLKVIFRRPLVIDFMDPWKASTWRPSKISFLERIQTFLEKFIVTQADFVIANTNELAQDFVDRLQISPEKVDVLTCGYDETDFSGNFTGKPNEHFTITHTGSFYKKRNPVNFLKAVKILLEKNFIPIDKLAINFIGSMAVKDSQLEQLLGDPLLKEIVHLESWVPHEKALEYLYNSDVLLLVQPETFLQIPAKLYEYVVLQKPIVALAEENGAVGNIIRREGWGETINNNNIEKISDVILQYYQAYINGKSNSNIKKHNIESYNVKNIASRMSGIFQQVLKKKALA